MHKNKDILPLSLPPQDIEIERAVLGACLLETDAFDIVAGVLTTPDYFYNDKHATVYAALLQLNKIGSKIDLLIVTNHLRKENKITDELDAYFLTQLTTSVFSSAHVEKHAYILAELYKGRELLRACQNTASMVLKNEIDIFDILAIHEKSISAISDGSGQTAASHIGQLNMDLMMQIEENKGNEDKLTGIETGYKELNIVTNGWQQKALIILAARPAVGKTALALNFAMHAAEKGDGVLMFSIEMSAMELVSRMAATKSEVFLYYINKRSLADWQENKLMQNTQYFNGLNIYVDDETKQLQHVVQKIKTHKKKHPDTKLIIIDYLQLMEGNRQKNGNREQEISEISRTLKNTAKKYDVAIIALSQLNRQSEGTADKKPQLSHLRESGAIEQDADMVLMLWREELENKEYKHTIVIAKNRAGSTPDIEMNFNKDIQRWEAINDGYSEKIPDNPQAGIRRDPYPNEEITF